MKRGARRLIVSATRRRSRVGRAALTCCSICVRTSAIRPLFGAGRPSSPTAAQRTARQSFVERRAVTTHAALSISRTLLYTTIYQPSGHNTWCMQCWFTWWVDGFVFLNQVTLCAEVHFLPPPSLTIWIIQDDLLWQCSVYDVIIVWLGLSAIRQ